MPSYKIIKVVNDRTRNLEERTLSKVHPDIHAARKHAEALAEKMQSLPTVKSPGKWTSDKRNLRVAQKGGYATTYLIRPISRPAGKSGGRKTTTPKTYDGRVRVHYTYTSPRGQGRSHVDVTLYAPHTREQLVEFFANDLECREQRGTFARNEYTVTSITAAGAPPRGAKKCRARSVAK